MYQLVNEITFFQIASGLIRKYAANRKGINLVIYLCIWLCRHGFCEYLTLFPLNGSLDTFTWHYYWADGFNAHGTDRCCGASAYTE